VVTDVGRAENTFSLRDAVFTPASITDPIQTILGPIGLDPCSHPHSPVPAAVRYYLPEYTPPGFPQGEPVPMTSATVGGIGEIGEIVTTPPHIAVAGDGLVMPWGPGLGLVFINPPYSKLSEEPWFLRALRGVELEQAHAAADGAHEKKRRLPTPSFAEELVWFVPVRTAGSWWQVDVVRVANMITFLNFRVRHVGEKHASPFHQALIYRGPRAAWWKERAEKMLGWTVPPDEVPF
jgi:hypothetical protein